MFAPSSNFWPIAILATVNESTILSFQSLLEIYGCHHYLDGRSQIVTFGQTGVWISRLAETKSSFWHFESTRLPTDWTKSLITILKCFSRVESCRQRQTFKHIVLKNLNLSIEMSQNWLQFLGFLAHHDCDLRYEKKPVEFKSDVYVKNERSGPD